MTTLSSSTVHNRKTLEPKPIGNFANAHFNLSKYWGNLLYGIGTLIVIMGPVLIGMEIMTWVTTFVGIDLGVLIICCLLGVWKSLTSSARGPRQKR